MLVNSCRHEMACVNGTHPYSVHVPKWEMGDILAKHAPTNFTLGRWTQFLCGPISSPTVFIPAVSLLEAAAKSGRMRMAPLRSINGNMRRGQELKRAWVPLARNAGSQHRFCSVHFTTRGDSLQPCVRLAVMCPPHGTPCGAENLKILPWEVNLHSISYFGDKECNPRPTEIKY